MVRILSVSHRFPILYSTLDYNFIKGEGKEKVVTVASLKFITVVHLELFLNLGTTDVMDQTALCGGPALCTVGCLAAALSPPTRSQEQPSLAVVLTKNVPRYPQMSRGGQQWLD